MPHHNSPLWRLHCSFRESSQEKQERSLINFECRNSSWQQESAAVSSRSCVIVRDRRWPGWAPSWLTAVNLRCLWSVCHEQFSTQFSPHPRVPIPFAVGVRFPVRFAAKPDQLDASTKPARIGPFRLSALPTPLPISHQPSDSVALPLWHLAVVRLTFALNAISPQKFPGGGP